MGRFTRRRFLITASTVAGTMSLGTRLGWTEPAKNEPDNLKLWYTSPASEWVDALPIGNGRLGAMVFGGGATAPFDPAKETLQLNEDTLWSGMPVDGNNPQAKEFLPAVRDALLKEKDYHKADQLCRKMQGLFAEAYQVVGSMHVDLKHVDAVTEYRRELNLATGVASTRYRAGEAEFERTAFASNPDQAIVLRIASAKAGELNATIWMDGELVKSVEAVGGNRLLLTGKAPKHVAGAGHPGSEKPVVLSDVPGEGMYYATVLETRVEGGHVAADGVVARIGIKIGYSEKESRKAASSMPNKHNALRRHHIPKMKFRVKNWAEYDAGLRRRGSLTLWVTAEVLDGWNAARRTTPGGQLVYSELAIETGMMLRLAFHLALRQTEGLMASIFGLLGVPLSTPDHSTLSRRARTMESIYKGCVLPDGPIHLLIDSTGLKVFGAGEWLQEKHGAKARRTWKKLHLAVDADTGMIMASTLTGNDVGDPSQVAPLLDQIEAGIASVTADGAYDGMPTYDVVAGHGEDVRVVIPPHVTAVLSAQAEHNPSQRDQHILLIAAQGRMGWQRETDYGQRALVETAMGRYKAIIGPRLRARSFSGQQAEAAIGVAILNRMLDAGHPDSVRRLNIAA